jgi:hypothetical protein
MEMMLDALSASYHGISFEIADKDRDFAEQFLCQPGIRATTMVS